MNLAKPFEYLTTAVPGQHPGKGHVYIIDSNGKKLASLWGDADTKMAMAELIIAASESTQGDQSCPSRS